jgi:putative DNA primase/helicase
VIPDRTEQLEKLHLEHIVRPSEPQKANGHLPTVNTTLTDEEVVALCRKARNAPKFERLYDRGNLSDYDGDESRADQALVSMMAFYTQDAGQLDNLFRGSALYRPEKWGKRADYRRRTIEKALVHLQ